MVSAVAVIAAVTQCSALATAALVAAVVAALHYTVPDSLVNKSTTGQTDVLMVNARLKHQC
jgi:hypothetical protein